ncbi:hypothetical protein RHGRI_015915 [Rhododendron griersonianum]|uniref:RING-type domain-containing protein n=1 Tax=Rhododendron griersonianum TaxID=479676 RepID=A0AAV6JRY8_9ERIC|nr:hypothetical protein RHGRI_015915 [Rhododendron griersonianum]
MHFSFLFFANSSVRATVKRTSTNFEGSIPSLRRSPIKAGSNRIFGFAKQNERLKTILIKESRQQHDILLQRYHSKTTNLMRQKDEDLAIATKKTMELEEYLRGMEMESQKWQRKARENEAKVAELKNTLTQVRERAMEAESVCDFYSNRGNREENRNRGQETEESEAEQSNKSVDCKLCFSKRCCVVFLPCRHLCSCKPCEGFVGFCPVCKSAKEASMEVYLV